ncbi:tail assembly chaperone [Solibacillus silvestris]
MAILKIKGEEFELKFSILLDKLLNKNIKDDEETTGKQKVTGGISKVLPQLIDMDVETLAQVFEIAIKYAPKDKQIKASTDDIYEAIDERMNEDEDAVKIFTDVFEAIDQSAFSRNELAKFVENMKLVKVMRTDEVKAEQMELMIKRMNDNYEKITGKVLIEADETAA